MKKPLMLAALIACLLVVNYTQEVALAQTPALPNSAQPPMANKLILYGDIAWYVGKGQPNNCILKSRFKRGEDVGFRMVAIDPLTGNYSETTDLVVHISYGGKTLDLPMRYRGLNYPQPHFHTLRWKVPNDAPLGVVRYTVTGKDKEGRTGEFKPFSIEESQLQIVD
jgi:hypothetical protein